MRPLCATCVAIVLACAASASAQLRLVPYVSGLDAPLEFVQDPAVPSRQYVVQQGGRIRVIQDGAVQPTPFLDLSAAISAGGERGLLGLAFPPDYSSSGRFFVNFTDTHGNTVVARFKRSSGTPLVADASTRFDLRWGGTQRFITQPFSNHNGGHLAFGPDGDLYVALGDGGSGDDPFNNAQNPNTLLGKLLRVDVNVGDADPNGYVVPADNPFIDGVPIAALPEIWSFGLRNPWKFTFDDPLRGGTGAMLIADVGQGAWEEVDYQPPGAGGRNYGWRTREGAHPYITSPGPAYSPVIDPIAEYDHGAGRSITGGFVYRGAALGATFRGRYFYADFITGRVWSIALVPAGGGEVSASAPVEHTSEFGGSGTTGNVSAFGVDAAGEMYVVSYSSGRILKVVSGTQPPHPTAVSDFDGDNKTDIALWRPAQGLWYVMRSSDGGVTTIPWGAGFPPSNDIPVPGDYDGDGRTDVAVWRPGEGVWYVMRSYDGGATTIPWGAGFPPYNDIPVPADYNGDRMSDVAVFRPSTGQWFVRNQFTLQWGQAGDIPVPGDYTGDGVADLAVFRPSTGEWWIRGVPTVAWGVPGDIPVHGDYNGDGVTDIAVFRPSTGQWFVRNQFTVQWSGTDDVPVPGDYDGDGTTDVAVFRPSTGQWFVRNQFTIGWGGATDWVLPHLAWSGLRVPGDYTRDGRADAAVYRPSTGEWWVRGQPVVSWGAPDDVPVPADYNGDTVTDVAVFRPSTGEWFVRNQFTVQWGEVGDVPVPADYNGDTVPDVAVFRPSTGQWFVRNQFTTQWGGIGDIPVPGDYDGDRKTDVAIYRPSVGQWWIPGQAVVTFGVPGDIPVPADYNGDGVTDIAVFRPSTGEWLARNLFTIAWGGGGDLPVPADFNGDGVLDLAVYRPSTGQWWVRNQFTIIWGGNDDTPVIRPPYWFPQ